MKKLVIGMIGRAGSGKDTIADYLCEKYEFKRMALADPLKESVKAMFMLNDTQVYNRVKREEPLPEFPDWSVRKLLQFIGTELMRKQFDDAVWAKLIRERIKNEEEHSRIVVTDVRFPNEMEHLSMLNIWNQYDISFIKTVREGCVGHNIGLGNHESEQYDLPADHTIDNNDSIEKLYDKVDDVLMKILANCRLKI